MMDRRDFLKLAAVSGLSVAAAPGLGRAFGSLDNGSQRNFLEEGEAPLFVSIQATGGWEPTLLCDPKGTTNNSYGTGDIMTAGNIAYAPLGALADTFFQTHYDRMCVFNGVDVQSNNHDAGQRNMSSGRLGDGFPNVAALYAGYAGPERPMSFLTFGGYEETGGLVAPTRSVDRERLAGIAYPSAVDPTQGGGERFHHSQVEGVINLTRRARSESMREAAWLPKHRHSLDTLMTSRLGSDQLRRLEELLPAAGGDSMQSRAQLIISAYRAGIGLSGNLTSGGFDTHGDHDATHSAAMRDLLTLVNTVWEEADRQGVADKVVMLISSDFGRTPTYNGSNGKDHWPISSMILVGADVPGNRVVGSTDEMHVPIPLDPDTLAEASNPDDGVRIMPQDVHRAVRRQLGIGGSEIDLMFPLPGEDLDLLA
jgi:hypothetical protein